jgi:hypothetical protein
VEVPDATTVPTPEKDAPQIDNATTINSWRSCQSKATRGAVTVVCPPARLPETVASLSGEMVCFAGIAAAEQGLTTVTQRDGHRAPSGRSQ